MLNRILWFVGRLGAIIMWFFAAIAVDVLISDWPYQAVPGIFVTLVCILAGIGLWSFGTVQNGKAKAAREARVRETMMASQASMRPSTPVEPFVRDDFMPATAGSNDEGSASSEFGEPEVSLASSEAEDFVESAQPEPPQEESAKSDDVSAGSEKPSEPADLGFASSTAFANITPEDFVLEADTATESAQNTADIVPGTAELPLNDLPEVREAVGSNALSVKLVRKAAGMGRDPKLVVLLGWAPVAEVEPGTAQYPALIDYAGKEGKLYVADDEGTLTGRLAMQN